MGQLQVRHEAGQPGQQAQVQDHRRRHRPGRRVRRGDARRARLQGRGVHVPRLAAAGALDRRAGRHQRRQELPGRRRQRSTASSTTRSRAATSAPARPTCTGSPRSASTSSTRWSPRACRSPASTAACSTTARFGGAQVSRTFYARGQTGQQLLLGAYQQLARQIGLGTVTLFNRVEMLDLVVIDGRCAGIVARDLLTGEVAVARRRTPSCSPPAATATSSSSRPTPWPATSPRRGGPTARGAYFANPCYTQIHPTCIPQSDDFQSKLTLMSESLRNDGRIWVPKNADDDAPADQIPEDERDYFLERRYPASATSCRATSPRAPPSATVDAGRGVGPLKNGVYLDFADAIDRARRRRHRGALRQPLRDVRAHHRRGPVRRCRCASTRPSTTRWAGSGSTTT